MILETKYASGKNTVRYKKNTGYSNHRELFDDLKDFQQQRDDNNDYSLQRRVRQPNPLHFFTLRFKFYFDSFTEILNTLRFWHYT